MDYAAAEGHLEIIKFLHYNREEAMEFASNIELLEVVMYMFT